MNRAAVTHYAHQPYAFPIDANTLGLRLRAARGDLKKVTVVYGSRYPEGGREAGLTQELTPVCRDREYDYFTAAVSLADPRFRYHFLLDDGQECIWYNERGFSRRRPAGFHCGYFQYPVINPAELFEPPCWVYDAVFYQIFPERFYNGNRDNDPAGALPWGDKPERESFFGGDLEGIIEKLNYLEDLGVNALYLTPIFKSPSNHKYNVDDYLTIDPHFGELEDLKLLVKEAHRRGIRIILDAVFNHSGEGFFAFQDLREKGAASRYRDWYVVDDFPVETEIPVNYRTFARNVPSMPKLVTSNPEVREYLLKAARYWLEEGGIDGWRLDVADEVDSRFWREFRQLVKSTNPEAYIVGEVWHNAGPWLRGDQYDAVMNYELAEAVYSFFVRQEVGPVGFDALLSKNRMLYQDSVNHAMLNLLDSHDTPRLAHLFKGNREALKLAVLFQMTYPGAPMIYYGDEVGLDGGGDPDSRRCMVWEKEKQDLELYSYYRKLIRLRRELIPLRRGDFQTVLLEEGVGLYGFRRSYQQDSVEVIINNSPHSREIALNDIASRGADRQRGKEQVRTGNNEQWRKESGRVELSEIKGGRQGSGEPVREEGLIDCLTGRHYRSKISLAPYQGVILSRLKPIS